MTALRAARAVIVQSEQLFSFAAICFTQEIADMELDSVFRYVKLFSYFLIGAALDNKPEDIGFSLREIIAGGKSLNIIYLRSRLHIQGVIEMEKQKDAYNKKQCHHGDKDHRSAAEHNS